ncbi:ADOP family duplicated permease [Acidicapsa dinghuensis]|uniref:ADOP family duplicated permease n=1 Tax=Acidicapsa dinghuensis TaxID=2218256 RepID=A0ABW1EMA0_9BACT|nr:ABC transporter permease [Acidicapsa dinghuensis]
MSLWSRVANVFRGDRLNREISEEFESHVAEAVASGRSEREARRALGTYARHREEGHQARVIGWLDSLCADAIFGWRQLMKRKVTTGAAILSLALAIGACTSAFRLVDAMFLRPMPVSAPASLYAISYHGFDAKTKAPESWDSNSYPMFREMRKAVMEQADLSAVSYVSHVDLTYGSDAEMEKAYRQSVSGSLFSNLGLRPVLGRLLAEDDDRVPGAEPYAVLSYDYWTRRFGKDSQVIGRRLHMDGAVYEIVGVASKGFTGTEPGTMTDMFVPTMMEAGSVNNANSFWLRIFVRVKPCVDVRSLAGKMDAVFRVWEKNRAKTFINFPKYLLDTFPREHLVLKSAAEGASSMQADYGSALTVLCVLVGMVLLIACANVANLMSAQAAARAREMALRVSIGSGRWRLVQMVMVESAMLGLIAAGLGLLFAWRATPFVVSKINPPDNPARLVLPADWMVIGFGLAMAIGVTLLFGLLPALRASGVKPVHALKGGDEPVAKKRSMYALIAAQVAFCFVVLFVAGLFATTLSKLTKQPIGFSPRRVLVLDTVTQHPEPPVKWDQMAAALRTVPGVETTALEDWPLMSGTMRNDHISVNGAAPSDVLAFFLRVSPGWLETMRIPMVAGRDFRDSDTSPSVAIVNEAFAKQYFNGANPVGRTFETRGPDRVNAQYEIVGLAGDVVYRDLREKILPQAYVPLHRAANLRADTPISAQTLSAATLQPMQGVTIVVRTASDDSILLSETLRKAMTRIDPEFRVSTIQTQTELVNAQTIRERLLASLALFFASLALLLAAIGLYGVLNYAVLQREREIGVRIALGARLGHVVRIVTAQVLVMVVAGGIAGWALGLMLVRYVQSLLYQVKGNDPAMLAVPALVLLMAVVLSAMPAVIRAARIDPATMLRAE